MGVSLGHLGHSSVLHRGQLSSSMFSYWFVSRVVGVTPGQALGILRAFYNTGYRTARSKVISAVLRPSSAPF
jgi:hypothetical protein